MSFELLSNIERQRRQHGARGKQAALAAAQHLMDRVEQRMPAAARQLLLDQGASDTVHQIGAPYLGMAAQRRQPARRCLRRNQVGGADLLIAAAQPFCDAR